MKFPVPLLLISLCSVPVMYAQDTLHASGQEVIESILDNSSDEQDVQHLGEEIEYLRDHPVNVAGATYSELIRIPFVSPLLAEAIIMFSDTVVITSVEQLRSVPLMTPVLFERLLPFITVEQPAAGSYSVMFLPERFASRSRIERRLQTTKGFNEKKFLGDEYSSYQRLKLKNTNLEMAGLFEKDAGEVYDDGLVAGYVHLKNISFIKNIVLGNYTLSGGQGLVFAKNISSTKGSDVVGQTRKRGSGISPSISTDEFRYFQGVAARIGSEHYSITGFYSGRDLSASIDSNDVTTSFFTSGLYRTTNDLARRNRIREKVTGGKFDYLFDPHSTVSFAVMNVGYDKFLKPSLFDLDGKRSISSVSVSWEAPLLGVMTYGESATNDIERFSKVVGIIFPVSRTLALNYHHRAYTKGYTAPFSRPFGERDNISDGESGNYLGIEFRTGKATINSYIDHFVLPSTVNGFGSAGKESFLHVAYSFSRQFDLTFHIRDKIRSQSEIRTIDDERHQTNYRIAFTFKVNPKISFTNRMEIVRVSYAPSRYNERGFLTFLEGTYRGGKNGVGIRSRIIFFDARSYDSRLYQYESDVAGNFSNPPMYGKGIRWYLVAGYELFNDFSLSFKYSETKKLNEVVLGTGDDEIIGNIDNQIAMQLDFQL